MEKSRMIRSKFWSDNWIQTKLNPLDRYLFLYLLTNEKTNICGIYELPVKIISVESGIDSTELERSMFPKLEEKVSYFDGWVILKNFQKHQNIESPSIIRAIQKEIDKIPKKVLEYAISSGYKHRVDTVSTPYGQSKEEEEVESKDKNEASFSSKEITTGDKYHPDYNPPKKKKSKLSDTQLDFIIRSKLIPIFKVEVNDKLGKEYFCEEDEEEDFSKDNSRYNAQIKNFWIKCKRDIKTAEEVIKWFAGKYGEWKSWSPAYCFRKETVIDWKNRKQEKKQGTW